MQSRLREPLSAKGEEPAAVMEVGAVAAVWESALVRELEKELVKAPGAASVREVAGKQRAKD